MAKDNFNFSQAKTFQEERYNNYGLPSEAQFFTRIRGDVTKILTIEESKDITDNDYDQLLMICKEILDDSEHIKLGNIGYSIKIIAQDYFNKLKSKKSREEELSGLKEILIFTLPKV